MNVPQMCINNSQSRRLKRNSKTWPLLAIANRPVLVLGVPALALYLFAVWGVIVVVLVVSAARRRASEEDE